MSSEVRGLLFILSAPSGAGKTTVARGVAAGTPGVVLSRSYTSRQPRGGERDGVDYHFVARDAFTRMRDEGEFLEWAEVFGELYGTRRPDTDRLLAAGRDVVLVIDVQGAAKVRERGARPIGIFLLPPSIDVLESRLRGRSQDTPEAIRRRLEIARLEIEACGDYDYVVVNDGLDACVDEVRGIVLAERARAARRRPLVTALLDEFGRYGRGGGGPA